MLSPFLGSKLFAIVQNQVLFTVHQKCLSALFIFTVQRSHDGVLDAKTCTGSLPITWNTSILATSGKKLVIRTVMFWIHSFDETRRLLMGLHSKMWFICLCGEVQCLIVHKHFAQVHRISYKTIAKQIPFILLWDILLMGELQHWLTCSNSTPRQNV